MELAIAESQTSIDAVHGPIFTADLFEFGGRQLLSLIAHHL
jgi:hypothetical protein